MAALLMLGARLVSRIETDCDEPGVEPPVGVTVHASS